MHVHSVRSDWELPQGHTYEVRNRADFGSLIRDYPGAEVSAAFLRCLDIVKDNGAKCVVIETGYIDPDFKSELPLLIDRSINSVPVTCHRLHFFRDEISEDDIGATDPSLTYLGYVVCKPIMQGLVSRAMLMPPVDIGNSTVLVSADERVHVAGVPYQVRGLPFCSENGKFGSCVAAVAWMALYTAFLRGWHQRVTRGEIHRQPVQWLSAARQVPLKGLNRVQTSEMLRLLGLPAFFYVFGPPDLGRRGRDEDRPVADREYVPMHTPPHPSRNEVVCRYLNSGLPVIMSGPGHSWLVGGYRRRSDPNQSREYLIHDDQLGPYLWSDHDADSAVWETRDNWHVMHAPAPVQLQMHLDVAEALAVDAFESLAELHRDTLAALGAADLDVRASRSNARYRTYVTTQNQYKENLSQRLAMETYRWLRRLRMPKFLIVTEIVVEAADGAKVVVGEVATDPTSHETRPVTLFAMVPGLAFIYETGQYQFLDQPADVLVSRSQDALQWRSAIDVWSS